MSAYGCKHLGKFSEDKVVVTTNVEHGSYIASVNGRKKRQSNVLEEQLLKETDGYWGILFQIIFQVITFNFTYDQSVKSISFQCNDCSSWYLA